GDAGSRLVARRLATTDERRVTLLGQMRLKPSDELRLARSVPGLRVAPLCGHRREGWVPAAAVDPAKRGRLAGLSAGDDVGATIAHLLPDLLPVSVVEGYAELLEQSRTTYG